MNMFFTVTLAVGYIHRLFEVKFANILINNDIQLAWSDIFLIDHLTIKTQNYSNFKTMAFVWFSSNAVEPLYIGYIGYIGTTKCPGSLFQRYPFRGT